MEEITGPSAQAFLFAAPRSSAIRLAGRLAAEPDVAWVSPAYGPHPVIGYLEAGDRGTLARRVEEIREWPELSRLDARICKRIPSDDSLQPFAIAKPESAVLLIGVDLSVAKEREVAVKLRLLEQVCLARAMWGPDDIVAIVEEADPERMRDFICDVIKVMPGVKQNTTLYCY